MGDMRTVSRCTNTSFREQINKLGILLHHHSQHHQIQPRTTIFPMCCLFPQYTLHYRDLTAFQLSLRFLFHQHVVFRQMVTFQQYILFPHYHLRRRILPRNRVLSRSRVLLGQELLRLQCAEEVLSTSSKHRFERSSQHQTTVEVIGPAYLQEPQSPGHGIRESMLWWRLPLAHQQSCLTTKSRSSSSLHFFTQVCTAAINITLADSSSSASSTATERICNSSPQQSTSTLRLDSRLQGLFGCIHYRLLLVNIAKRLPLHRLGQIPCRKSIIDALLKPALHSKHTLYATALPNNFRSGLLALEDVLSRCTAQLDLPQTPSVPVTGSMLRTTTKLVIPCKETGSPAHRKFALCILYLKYVGQVTNFDVFAVCSCALVEGIGSTFC